MHTTCAYLCTIRGIQPGFQPVRQSTPSQVEYDINLLQSTCITLYNLNILKLAVTSVNKDLHARLDLVINIDYAAQNLCGRSPPAWWGTSAPDCGKASSPEGASATQDDTGHI